MEVAVAKARASMDSPGTNGQATSKVKGAPPPRGAVVCARTDRWPAANLEAG